MEIEYSNFDINKEIFQENKINGLIDLNSNLLYNKIYNIQKVKYNYNQKVKYFFLKELLNNSNILKTLEEDFYINKEVLNRKMEELSTSELCKTLLIKACLSDAKVIILKNIDMYFNDRDLKDLFFVLKKHIEKIKKTIIFSTSKIDNIILNVDNYIIARENEVLYSGNSISSLNEKTDIIEFVDAANKKGAKLHYYKDRNDLLKAIYRSVKK